MMGDVKDFLFYDIEVFSHNSMVVFKNYEEETVRVFSSSLDGLGELYDKHLIKDQGYAGLEAFIEGKTLVGYNNYFYDDFILRKMCEGGTQEIIKTLNDSIIQNKSTRGIYKLENCKTLDAFQQIDISRPSLKKIEGNMGKSIVESSIDFDIDRPLTAAENLETFRYCEYDVGQTVQVFKLRRDYFESKDKIVEMLPEEKRDMAYKWNTTSIIGQLLEPKQKVKSGRLVSDELLELVPLDVQTMWRELDHTLDYQFKQKKVVVEECGCDIEFGWGGLHGAPIGVYEAKDVKLYDVQSMYPSILILFKGLGDKTKDYQDILDYRLELKAQGKKKEQAPYKLILNSTYGLLNNQYNSLNKPSLAFSICIYGQISLYVLCQRLHAVGCKVFNINTDGVAFVPDRDGAYVHIVEDWEKMFNLKLEEDSFKSWRQTNVNNYVAVTDKGQIKVKGGDVNNYHDFGSGGRNYFFNNANTRIVHKAVVDKIVEDKSIPETIWENRHRPELYQYILQAGSTYEGTFDTNGKKLQKVNRVFAGKRTGYELFKKRQDGGLVKFPDAPRDMFVFNDDLSNLTDFENRVDVQWYTDLAEKVYSRWKL